MGVWKCENRGFQLKKNKLIEEGSVGNGMNLGWFDNNTSRLKQIRTQVVISDLEIGAEVQVGCVNEATGKLVHTQLI